MEKTIAMNSAQINYFSDRIKSLKNMKIRELEEVCPLPASLTREEMLSQIHSGKAALKSSITPDECTYEKLLTAFDYEGDDLRQAQKREVSGLRTSVTKKIERYANNLRDKFAVRLFPTEKDVLKALKTFEDKKFI